MDPMGLMSNVAAKAGLLNERDKMVYAERGKITEWWLEAEPFVDFG
jgi:hypothetical protein